MADGRVGGRERMGRALLQVRLHGKRVLGLREDLEQLVVRQKVEAREGDASAGGWVEVWVAVLVAVWMAV